MDFSFPSSCRPCLCFQILSQTFPQSHEHPLQFLKASPTSCSSRSLSRLLLFPLPTLSGQVWSNHLTHTHTGRTGQATGDTEASLGWIPAFALHPHIGQEASPSRVADSHTPVTFRSLPSSAADAPPHCVTLSPASFISGAADQELHRRSASPFRRRAAPSDHRQGLSSKPRSGPLGAWPMAAFVERRGAQHDTLRFLKVGRRAE